MEQITNFIENITSVQILDIVIAVLIILFFRILPSNIIFETSIKY